MSAAGLAAAAAGPSEDDPAAGCDLLRAIGLIVINPWRGRFFSRYPRRNTARYGEIPRDTAKLQYREIPHTGRYEIREEKYGRYGEIEGDGGRYGETEGDTRR